MKFFKICWLLTLLSCSWMLGIDPVEAKALKPFDSVHVVIDQELINGPDAAKLKTQLQQVFLVPVDVLVVEGDGGQPKATDHTARNLEIYIEPNREQDPHMTMTGEIMSHDDEKSKIVHITVGDIGDRRTGKSSESDVLSSKFSSDPIYKLVLQQVGKFAGLESKECVMHAISTREELEGLPQNYCALDQKILHEQGIWKLGSPTQGQR